MTSVGIFGDLPPIAFNDDGPLNTNWPWSSYADRNPQWPNAHPSSYHIGNPLLAAGSPTDASRMHNMSAMQRYLHGPERTLFTAEVLHLETGFGEYEPARRFEFNSQQKLQAPWPYGENCHRQVSPDSTSLSSSSYSGPHHFHSDEVHSANHASRRSSDGASEYGSQGLPYAHYSAYDMYPMEATMGGGSCNLREIQPYPSPVEDADQEPMDHDDYAIDVKISAEPENSYYRSTKSEVEQEHDTYMTAHPDEEDTIRIREAESVQPCIKDDDDGDDDYKPNPVPAKRPRRRLSQCSTSSGSSSRGPAKRHTSTRKASTSSTQNQTRRVTKRQSLSKSHHSSSSSSPKSSSASPSSANAPRPFPCPLAAYSCTSTFASKNEWKRHVSTQHIRLGFWRCDLCPALSVGGRDEDDNDDNTNNSNEDDDGNNNTSTISYNDFNRKDLFAQHLRRMHLAPAGTANPSPTTAAGKRSQPGNAAAPSAGTTATLHEADLAAALDRCYCRVREAPTHSACLFCSRTFEGKDSWAERMEHVGRHLEQSRKGKNGACGEKGVVVGEVEAWREDVSLREWLVREGLVEGDGVGGWKLGNGVPVRRGTEAVA